MNRCASGGIILSSLATRYQLGLVFHAASVTLPFRASSPHGTCDSAMNAAVFGSTSPANAAANLALSRRESLDQRSNGLAIVGRKSGDIDERRDLGIVARFT